MSVELVLALLTANPKGAMAKTRVSSTADARTTPARHNCGSKPNRAVEQAGLRGGGYGPQASQTPVDLAKQVDNKHAQLIEGFWPAALCQLKAPHFARSITSAAKREAKRLLEQAAADSDDSDDSDSAACSGAAPKRSKK